MAHRNIKIYVCTETEHDPNFRHATFTFTADKVTSLLRVPLPKVRPCKRHSISSQSLLTCKVTPEGQAKRLKRQRTKVKKAAEVNAVLSWVVTVLGYLELKWWSDGGVTETVLESSIAALSVVQTAVVVWYWNNTTLHEKAVAESINTDKLPVARLRNSPKKLVQCCCECVFHAAALYPYVHWQASFVLFGTHTELPAQEALFILLVLRNYHTVRYIYWSSHLSGMRVRFFAHIWNVQSQSVFVLKCYLAEYAVLLVAEIFVIMLVVSGLVYFAVERGALDNTWDHFCLIAVTQSTIGYGDTVPGTFIGQVAVLVSCFVGILLLGLVNSFSTSSVNLSVKEGELYTHLTSALIKQRWKSAAVKLVQCWWRLMKARLLRVPRAHLVLSMYAQLGVYRRVVLRTRNIHCMRLEKQLQLLQSDINRKVNHITDHLRPVFYSDALSDHFLQGHEYIHTACRSLLRSIKRNSSLRLFTQPSTSSDRLSFSHQRPYLALPAVRRQSKQQFAKAQTVAFVAAMSFCVNRARSPTGSSTQLSEERFLESSGRWRSEGNRSNSGV